jgi:Na+-transporting methylmalonyl-CoA/oxaloacetate decarboxylase gamma subunit
MREVNLKDLSFGLTMTFWGMGITLLTLGLLILIIRLMNKLFPFKKENEKKD